MDAYMTRIDDEMRESAREHWKVTTESVVKVAPGSVSQIVYVEAEAKTGSRYVVIVTPMPHPGCIKEGGRFLVTVLQPWQDAWTVSNAVDETYVRERFAGGQERHPGDLTAITMTINRALEVATR